MSPSAPQSKDLREVLKNLKPGFELESDNRGHFTLLKDGETVRDEGGKPIKLPSTTSSNRTVTAARKRLEAVDALERNGQVAKRRGREHTPDAQLQIERSEAELAGEQRVSATKKLRERLDPLLAKAGGEIRTSDLARVAAFVHGTWQVDSAMTTTGSYLAGKALGDSEIERMIPLLEKLEKAPDARAEWFMLLRETLGLDQPTLTGGREWPFTVKLVPLEKVFSHWVEDGGYQRPVEENFVRDLTLRFDERLVGTIDVSERGDGRYAVIDGQQRSEAMKRVGKTSCYCSVYEGLTVPQEATLFFHKNRDRRQVNPYYEFMARVAAEDPEAIDILRIVDKEGFELHTSGGAGKIEGRDRNITAIRAVEEVYRYDSEVRQECLTPTLSVIFRNWFGRKDSLNTSLIRGLGRCFRVWADAEIQWQHWEEQLEALGPSLVLGMGDDQRQSRSGQGKGIGVSLALVEIHNRGLPRGQRLDSRLVQTWRKPPTPSYRQS